MLEDSPEFFVARGNTSFDIVVLALTVTLVPPSLLLACEALLLPWPNARRTMHLVFVAALLAAVALQLLDDLGIDSGRYQVLALLAGVAGALVYARTRFVPAVMSVLAVAPVLLLLNFLFISPVSDLVLSKDGANAAAAEVRGTTPVVVVIFDEFSAASRTGRDGRIDPGRFPNFAGLAKLSTWYRNATTVADETPQAVPALLTGRRPTRTSSLSRPIIRKPVHDAGRRYRLQVSEPATDLCPERLCGSEDSGPPATGCMIWPPT